MQEDIFFMRRALALAERGAGKVNPNPLVGAVIVKDSAIIGEGWHEEYGGLHAERGALAACRESAEGATLYVTLEPCCHYGKTPPCTEAILEHGISRVVVGSLDSNPLVAGKGIRLLREAGIAVTQGVLAEECDYLNRIFFHFIGTKTPYVTMKYAMTMDGKIATYAGHTKWITAAPATVRVPEDRIRHMAIMTGAGTVLADDPALSCRIPGGRQPVRLICDSRLRTPPDARIVKTAAAQPTWFLTCQADEGKREALMEKGCQVLRVPEKDGHVDLRQAMAMLGERGIDSVYLEGGAELNASALQADIVQEVHCYMAPKLFGGRTAPTPLGGCGVELPEQARRLQIREISRYGEDILIESRVRGDAAGKGETDRCLRES